MQNQGDKSAIKWGPLCVIGLIVALLFFFVIKPLIGGIAAGLTSLVFGGAAVIGVIFLAMFVWGRWHS